MMRHAWDNYVKYAWGMNELKPISRKAHNNSVFGAAPLGATIVDGLDTLYIMGFHDEFKRGRDWIAEHLNLEDIVSNIIGILRFNNANLNSLYFIADVIYVGVFDLRRLCLQKNYYLFVHEKIVQTVAL